MVICLEWGAYCLHIVQLMPLYLKTPPSLASFKSRLILPFWYQLTQVVPEKTLLNRCSVVVVIDLNLKLCLTWNSLYYIICRDLPFLLDFELFLSTATTVLWPVYRSTCVSWHLQLRTGGFCSCKVFLPTCRCWWQPVQASLLVREETLEFSSTVCPEKEAVKRV